MNIGALLKGVGFGDLVEKGVKAVDDMVVTENELRMARMDLDRAQIEVNKKEAGHRSVFVAGWRPAVGWVCVAGLSYTWLIGIMVEHLLGIPRVELETGEITALLFALLGMGGLRTYEKLKKRSREHL